MASRYIDGVAENSDDEFQDLDTIIPEERTDDPSGRKGLNHVVYY